MSKAIPADEAVRRAAAEHFAGRLQAAEKGYRRILGTAPNHAECLHLLGVLLHQTGRSDKAVGLIEKAIARQPRAVQYRNNLGNVLRDSGRPADAVTCYEAALQIDPALPDLHHNLGKALAALDRRTEAEAAFRQALRLRPLYPDAQLDLGNLLNEAARFEEALSLLQAIVAAQPDHVLALNSLGVALGGLNRFDDAAETFRTAVRRQPGYVKSWNNLGFVLLTMKSFEEAAAAFRQALRFAPDDAELHAGLGHLLLLTGHLTEGWPELEWQRLVRKSDVTIDFPAPTWNGEDIGSDTLVLYADQGLGDAMQFARYIPLCAQRARVVLALPPPLRRLLGRMDGVAGLLNEPPMPEGVVHCPLSSLGRIFGTDLSSIPADIPYLAADPARAAELRQRLEGVGDLRVGLVWGGNPRYTADYARSIALQRLTPLADIPGVSFVSLQKGPAATELASAGAALRLYDLMDEMADLSDTASLIEALDLVIGVDTGVIHLAGALGKPVWLLNRYDPDWRWLLDRDDSPWYPTLR